jgi:hypothetical protein
MSTEGTETRRRNRIAPVHVALATAVLGLLVMPIAFAGANGSQATASGNTKTQLKSLKRRVAALENKAGPNIPTTLPPSGPAGGILQGTYPNPSGLAVNSVGFSEIVNGSIGQAELGAESVGAGQLKATYERVSDGTGLGEDEFGNATTSCNPGDKILGGGFAWQEDAANSIIFSTPNVAGGGFDNPDQWIVRGVSAADNTLFAWAVCLRA